MILLQMMVIFCLAFICYQDLLYRAVYWLCFPVLTILVFILKYKSSGLQETLIHASYSIVFLTFQLATLWIYFSIKKRKNINLTRDYLGWGDVLFLVAITFYLSPGNYIVFYVISLIVVLLYTILTGFVSKKIQNLHIPLAGLQAALLALLILVDQFSSKFMLYDDSWFFF